MIDRCGKHFGTILNYLRDGAVPLPESRREIEELLAEAKYYLVQGLVDECQAALQVSRYLRTHSGYKSPFVVCLGEERCLQLASKLVQCKSHSEGATTEKALS